MDTLINRRSHGHTEKQNFSLSVEKNSNSEIFLFTMRKEISYLQEAMQCSIITGAKAPMKYQDI